MSQDLPVPLPPKPNHDHAFADFEGEQPDILVWNAASLDAYAESYARACMAPLQEENAKLHAELDIAHGLVKDAEDAEQELQEQVRELEQEVDHQRNNALILGVEVSDVRALLEAAEAELSRLKDAAAQGPAQAGVPPGTLSDPVAAAPDENASGFEIIAELRAELARLKAQEPVAYLSPQVIDSKVWAMPAGAYTAPVYAAPPSQEQTE